jgi:hypothetical protein
MATLASIQFCNHSPLACSPFRTDGSLELIAKYLIDRCAMATSQRQAKELTAHLPASEVYTFGVRFPVLVVSLMNWRTPKRKMVDPDSPKNRFKAGHFHARSQSEA